MWEIEQYLMHMFDVTNPNSVPQEVYDRCARINKLIKKIPRRSEDIKEPALRDRQIVALVVEQWERELKQSVKEEEKLTGTSSPSFRDKWRNHMEEQQYDY